MGYRPDLDLLPEEDTGGNFIVRHWRGQLSLPKSWFLVGGLLSAVVVNLLLLGVLGIQQAAPSLQVIAIAWISFFALFLAIRTWAVVGIWRSAGRHEDRGGEQGWAYFARFLLVAGVALSLFQAKSYGLQSLEYGRLALGRDPLGAPVALASAQQETELRLSGFIAQGSADAFTAMADRLPKLRTVHLESGGGRIWEAQRIAEYVRKRGLDTRVETQCESACTLVLLAGKQRSTERLARVGFHQPSFPGITEDQRREAIAANSRDYEQAGMDRQFVDRMMATPDTAMWYPTHDELVDAGVVTAEEMVVSDANKDSLGLALKANAEQINRVAPKTIDEVTRLLGAEAIGHQLVIQHEITFAVDTERALAIRRALTPDVRGQTCADPIGQRLIEAGGKIVYRYQTAKRAKLFDIAVTACA